MAQACQFSSATQTFSGSAAAQASCLLRKVRIGGNIDTGPAPLPDKLQSLVGQPPTFTKAQLGQYLARKGISAATIGGDLGGAVSQTLAGNPATYFVIHDTSDELVGSAFPTTINTAAWPSNDLASRPVIRLTSSSIVSANPEPATIIPWAGAPPNSSASHR